MYNNGYDVQPEVLSGAPKVFSIVSMVCGIISMIACCYGFIFSIPAIIFSIVAKSKFKGKNTMAKLGLIFGIVGAALSFIWIIAFVVMGAFGGGTFGGGNYYY